MCKQSGSNTSTVVQNPTIPDWLSTQFQNLATRAEGLSNTPYNPGIQKNVADFSPDQVAAFDMTRQNVGEFRPYTDVATGYAQIGGSTIGANQIANYSNPFQQQVIDATMGNIQQNNELQRKNMRGNAALQGGLHNDRTRVAESELARNQNLATNQTLASLNAQNYNQALGAAQADRSAAQTAAGQFSNLGTAVSNLAAGDAARLSASGGLQQALQQQQLDTTSANIAQQENYPYAQASFLGGMLQGASPSFTGTQSTTTQPGPSTLNQVLGLGAVGLGAFMGSDPRIKDDLGEVGTLDDGTPIHAFRYKDDPSGKTFFGPMSTDVAEDTKIAVGPDGIEMVDYAAVAEDAREARDGYYTGGNVQLARYKNPTQGGMQGPGPYQGGAAGLDALAMQTAKQLGQPVQTPKLPAPKTRASAMVDEANDLADSFRTGQTLHKAAGKAMGGMSETAGEGGWSTKVMPESGEGTRNMMAAGLGGLLGMADGGRVGYNLGGGVYGQPNDMVPASVGPYQQTAGNIVPPMPMPAQRPGAGRFAAKGLAPFAGQGAVHNEMESMAAAMPSPGASQNEMETAAAMMPAPGSAQNEMETLAALPQGGGGVSGGAGQVSASGQPAGGLGSLGFGSNPALGQALMAGGAAFAGGRNIGEGLARAMPGAMQAYRTVQMDEAAKKQRELQNRIAEERAAQAVKEFEARKLENQVAERTKVADQQGLMGAARQRFILTGDLPASVGTGKTSLTPIYGVDKDGRPVVLQPTDRGEAVATQLPEGVTISRDPIRMDAGTHFVLLDPVTRQQIGIIPKENQRAAADKARGTEIGKSQGGALNDLPKVESEAQSVMEYIEAVEKDPNLPNVLGYAGQLPVTVIPKNRTTMSRINQLKGKAFLSAFESLKGAGQITEVEGQKATDALARLNDTGQDEPGYRAALADFKNEVQRLLANARKKAAAAQSAQRATTKSDDGWSVEVVK